INIDELVEKSEGYVGADIELVVREAKLSAMREFIAAMENKSEEERIEVLSNVRVTKKHFNAAMKKIKSSLDKSAIEEYERKAWPVIYSTEERQILEKAATAIKRSEFGDETENKKILRDELEKATYSRRKDFDLIVKLTEDLEKIMKQE
ncbi:MAG: AAA family ATPase, partial [Methanomicrobium sp.]|nr:AAA family ATPase [Methanomicrobium sp.]